jgi:outer membrane protein OmpA-like peptidoglycan-associated protein
MFHRIAALLFACAAGTAAPALSQTAPNPTQAPASVAQGDVPVFRMTVVGRTLPAVNYRPRSGDTRINFAGTALLPKANGWASITGEDGYIKIDARFDNLEAPGRYGVEYLTYVLWAITPEGRASNLGEIQYDDDDADIEVTTELQSFGLIVTAEPYFAVTQPSDVVVIENVVRTGGFERTQGRVEAIEAKYELLKRGSYLMNQDAARANVRAPEPGVSLDLAQARNAVALSRLARADRYAEETFGKAEKLLAEAELAREKRRRGNAVMQPARQAVQTAEDARIIALQRQEEERLAEERAQAEAARQRALAEEERRRQAELSAREAALAAQDEAIRRQQAEAAAREAASAAQAAASAAQAEESRRRQAERDAQAAAAARAAAERQLAEAEATRLAAEAARAQAEADRQRAEAERQQAEAARLTAEQQAAQARQAADASEQEKAQLREQLRQQLNQVLETRETARGLIVNVSDVLFDVDKATLRPGARERLARVSGILLAHPGLRIAVEGHTDSTGSDSYNQRLSEARAASVRDYLVRNGIEQGAVGTTGFGESQPVATNETPAGRQQNRRVELVVTGEAIDR